MLRLAPPHQPLPDNLWHTLFIAALAAAFLWLGWLDGLEQFRSGEALSLSEIGLRDGGQVHPLFQQLESVTDPLTPWVWNRVVSAVGWVLALSMVVRVLTRVSGFLSSLPSLLLLATLPAFSLRMCAGGSGSFAIWLFLLAFSALLLEEDGSSWMRGGIYAALAAALAPHWLLPSVGLLVGVWEVNRVRLPRAALGFGITFAACIVLLMVFAPTGLSAYIPSFEGVHPFESLPVLLLRYPLLLGAGLLMLVIGATRRGLLWWCLVFSIPASLLNPASPPLILLLLVGLARLPALIGIQHPRVYQSALLCQLLLWLPSYL